jgi:hypothetical protein
VQLNAPNRWAPGHAFVVWCSQVEVRGYLCRFVVAGGRLGGSQAADRDELVDTAAETPVNILEAMQAMARSRTAK